MRVLVLIGCLTLAGFSFAQEEDSIRSCFETYKQAVIDHDGDLASANVTETTLDYYQNLVKLAQEADSVSIAKLRLIDKLTVLSIRLKMLQDPDYIADGRSYFSRAINNGWVEQGGIRELQLGEINVSQNFAAAHLIRNEEETPLYFNFHFEDSWKLDLTSLLFATEEMLQNSIKQMGINESDFIQNALLANKENELLKELWNPVKDDKK